MPNFFSKFSDLDRYKIPIATLLFIVCLSVRLIGITDPTVQSDEAHWKSRSARFILHLRDAPLHATSHLGHPGIPSAIAMGIGQMAASHYNSILGLEHKDHFYLDEISACRVANAILSSFIAPLVFCGFCGLIGILPALLAAFFVIFDPNHIGLSQIAHIDSGLTLWVTATLLFYYHAVRSHSLKLKIVAGFFWGLSIATKPTAITLLLVFVAYKLFLRIRNKDSAVTEPIVAWSDFLAVLSGHITFALIYTRMWWHESEYLTKLKIKSPIADFLFSLGIGLNGHFLWILILAVICLTCWFLKSKRTPLLNWTLCLSALSLLLSLVPQVFENFARYWSWVFSLKGMEHDGFIFVAEPHPWGYLGIFLSNVPTVAILGLIFSLFTIFNSQRAIEFPSSRAKFILLLTLTTLIWTLPLSTSSKQSWRYVLPILPVLYTLAAIGWVQLLTRFRVSTWAVLPVAAIYSFSFFSVFPNYDLFASTLGGPLAKAIDRGEIRPRYGVKETIQFLVNEPRSKGAPRYITVLGDGESFKHVTERMYGKTTLLYGYFPPEIAHYLLVPAASRESLSAWDIVDSPPAFTIDYQGINLFRIWRVDPSSFNRPREFNLSVLPRNTGKVKKTHSGVSVVSAAMGKTKPGALFFFPHAIRFAPGSYEIELPVNILKAAPDSTPTTPALAFELNKNCSRIYTLSELHPPKTTLTLKCSDPGYGTPRLTWAGKVGVSVEKLVIRRIEEQL